MVVADKPDTFARTGRPQWEYPGWGRANAIAGSTFHTDNRAHLASAKAKGLQRLCGGECLVGMAPDLRTEQTHLEMGAWCRRRNRSTCDGDAPMVSHDNAGCLHRRRCDQRGSGRGDRIARAHACCPAVGASVTPNTRCSASRRLQRARQPSTRAALPGSPN